MKWFLRLVFTPLLLAGIGLCLFGFLATFEPLPPVQQWLCRTVYGAASVLAVWGICRLWRSKCPTKPNAPLQGL